MGLDDVSSFEAFSALTARERAVCVILVACRSRSEVGRDVVEALLALGVAIDEGRAAATVVDEMEAEVAQ